MILNDIPVPSSNAIISAWIPNLLRSSIALGFITMAIIQVIKPFIKRRFHRWKIEKYFSYNADRQEEYYIDKNIYYILKSEVISILHDNSLLELPIEQLTAQLQKRFEWVILKYSSDSAPEQVNVLVQSRRNDQVYELEQTLDRFQIDVRSRWRRLLYSYSFIICFLLTSSLAERGNPFLNALFVVLVSFIGSFFASVARDIVAIIERFRN